MAPLAFLPLNASARRCHYLHCLQAVQELQRHLQAWLPARSLPLDATTWCVEKACGFASQRARESVTPRRISDETRQGTDAIAAKHAFLTGRVAALQGT